MVNINDGSINIGGNDFFGEGYSYNDFKKSIFYDKQDPKRIVNIDNPIIINGRKYLVDLFFNNKSILYAVFLYNIDEEFTEATEYKLKEYHDMILRDEHIDVNKTYSWGKIRSEYDPRANSSFIAIYHMAARPWDM